MVIESLDFLGGKGCFEHIYLQLVWFVVVVNVKKYHLHRVVWDTAPFNFGDKCNVISRGLKLQHVSFLEACVCGIGTWSLRKDLGINSRGSPMYFAKKRACDSEVRIFKR